MSGWMCAGLGCCRCGNTREDDLLLGECNCLFCKRCQFRGTSRTVLVGSSVCPICSKTVRTLTVSNLRPEPKSLLCPVKDLAKDSVRDFAQKFSSGVGRVEMAHTVCNR